MFRKIIVTVWLKLGCYPRLCCGFSLVHWDAEKHICWNMQNTVQGCTWVRRRELCVHACSQAVYQDQHHPGTMLVLHKRFRGFHWCIFCNFFLNQQEDPIHPRTFLFWLRCANVLQRETVLPVNISEWPRLDHDKWEPLDQKLENIQSILQLWDQG